MLTDEQRRDGAARLIAAERDRVAIQQLSIIFPGMELEDAYAIQMMWAEQRIAAGARIVGHKIGLTSRAMQMAFK